MTIFAMAKMKPQEAKIPMITRTDSSKQVRLPNSLFSPKLSVCMLAACVVFFIIFQMQSLQTSVPPASASTPTLMSQIKSFYVNNKSTSDELTSSLTTKLRQSVTFLPLKDLKFSPAPLEGHTWFMSTLYDTQEPGEVQHQHFPSKQSQNRILCVKGHDNHDGVNNYYALAWPEALPENATLLKGLTFISYNHYDYGNIWHGLSAVYPFVAWHKRNYCQTSPARWVLFHWGEIRSKMGAWLEKLMEATFEQEVKIETFEGFKDDEAVCFEEAVVMRHNEGGMSKERRMETYDLLRCKARAYCNLSLNGHDENVKIGMSAFLRNGPRAFKNESAVVELFRKECERVDGCRFQAAHSSNLTFCEQVKFMGETDILISPHGAQLTNMFFMNQNSSVMEFFPKGWLKLAGVGQFVYHWIASWSGMRHEGVWRDPDGVQCPHPEGDRRCMTFYKDGLIGLNETYFSEWGRAVLSQVRARKMREPAIELDESSLERCSC